MRVINREELNIILKNHKLWLERKGGKRADLSDTKLNNVDLRYAVLRQADLSYSNLRCADLAYTDLRDANLKHADLEGAYLRESKLNNANLDQANLKHADLENADLRDADFSFACLEHANLRYADLEEAILKYTHSSYVGLNNTDLSGARLDHSNLSDANFKCADLTCADLRYANLRNADLSYANINDVDLRDADLRGANLKGVETNMYTTGYNLACPEKGSFIGYKRAGACIIELLIPESAKRSSATTMKCRCDKAIVKEIRNIETGELVDKVCSDHDHNFIYKTGKAISVDNYDDDRWNECSAGIHFFMNRENAISYKRNIFTITNGVNYTI